MQQPGAGLMQKPYTCDRGKKAAADFDSPLYLPGYMQHLRSQIQNAKRRTGKYPRHPPRPNCICQVSIVGVQLWPATMNSAVRLSHWQAPRCTRLRAQHRADLVRALHRLWKYLPITIHMQHVYGGGQGQAPVVLHLSMVSNSLQGFFTLQDTANIRI